MSSIALSLALALGACAPDTSETTSPPVDESRPTPAPTSTQPLVVGCAAAAQFTEGGPIDTVENLGSDATGIGLIRWQADDACETFEIEFETAEGAPATTPPSITAEFIGDLGVLRILTSARDTVIADQLVETGLVDRIFVVRSLAGEIFIDFHLAAPTQANVELLSSPARLRLQLQPGIVGYTSRPMYTERVVLLEPTEDTEVATRVDVSGYARTVESNVLLIATQGDDVLDEVATLAADSLDTWGEFRAALELAPGPVALFVGDENAESGRFEGVSIDLEAR